MIRICILLVGLLSICAASAQTPRLYFPSEAVHVGERFELTLVLTVPDGGVALYPEASPDGTVVAGDAVLLSARRLPPRLGQGMRTDSLVYQVATFALDRATLGPIATRLVQAGDTTVVLAGPVEIAVRSSLTPADTMLVLPEGPLDFPREIATWWLLVIAGLLALIALAAWLLRRRRQRPERALPPKEETLRRIDQLSSPSPDSREEIRSFYTETADILRRYLARSVDESIAAQTTSEVGATLTDRGLDPALVARVEDALKTSDLVKFAGLTPPPERLTETPAALRQLVNELDIALTPPQTS